MSPILVRPVREQLEHDRIIRLLQARYRRKHEVGMNPGAEQNAALGAGDRAIFPDLILYAPDKGRKVQAIVEVETAESVNHLEALAEWAPPGRLNTPLHLYVPASAGDVARRLAQDHQIPLAEVWTYHTIGDQVRFTLVHKSPEEPAPSARKPPRPRAKPVVKAAAAVKAGRPAKAAAAKTAGRATAPRRTASAPPRKAAKVPARRPTAARAKKAVPVRKAAAKQKRK